MEILGKTKLNIADQNAIINQISNTYKDFFRAAMEYIDNSIDVATINKKNGLEKDYKVYVNIDTYNKTISFLDNCGGMSPDELCNLLSNVGKSTKKAVSWANGQFGFGVHSFRAFAKIAQFVSNNEGNEKLLIESQIVAELLQYFRDLTQVMIGEAISISELKAFLYENDIMCEN